MDLGSQRLLHRLGGEECWSEGATSALIEAWGDRHLRLNRGSFRQKDWVEVAEAVNQRLEAERMLSKTDAQCKNRIESLKKKYKIEKAKPGLSQWSFFSRLDLLIGNAASESHSSPSPFSRLQYDQPLPKQHISLASAVKHRNPDPCEDIYGLGSYHEVFVDGNYTEGIDNEKESDAEDDGEQDRELNDLFVGAFIGKRQRKWGLFGCGFDGGYSGGDGAFGELAKAIMKLTDVYERVETTKQKQLMEMERKRMEFAKDFELERMKMFMEAQINLEKLKRAHKFPGSSSAGYSRLVLKEAPP